MGPNWVPNIQAAFQKLSEAFEHLNAKAETSAAPQNGQRPKRKREKPWWDVPTWEETGKKGELPETFFLAKHV